MASDENTPRQNVPCHVPSDVLARLIWRGTAKRGMHTMPEMLAWHGAFSLLAMAENGPPCRKMGCGETEFDVDECLRRVKHARTAYSCAELQL